MEAVSTEIVRVDPEAPESEAMARAAEVLRSGGLVAFPTETVYGLGANALDAEAVARIFAAKGRPSYNPLIVHAPELAGARALTADWPEMAQRLAERFWPGPLTLVLPKSQAIPDIVTGGGPTVAVRVPAHPVALALLRTAGIPLAAPSANRSNRLSPTRAEHVAADLTGRIAMILDGGPTTGGIESTVLDLTTTPPRLLRPGLIAPTEIEAILGPIERKEIGKSGNQEMNPTDNEPISSSPLPSPGMMMRHYAPRAHLEFGNWSRVRQRLAEGERVGWLTFTERDTPPSGLTTVRMPHDPTAYAAQLYAMLHALDAEGVTCIVVTPLPRSEPWQALQDRLSRAATPSKPES